VRWVEIYLGDDAETDSAARLVDRLVQLQIDDWQRSQTEEVSH
jgi:hypothetical protein